MGKGRDHDCAGAPMPAPELDLDAWLSGWALTHDYDPRWDYEVRVEQRGHPTLLLAQRTLDAVSAQHPVPWEEGRVYPAALDGPLAVFVAGTSGAPVVLVDLDAHLHSGRELGLRAGEIELAVTDSVRHELRHAYQEAHGWQEQLTPEAYEHEAEHGSARIPF